MAGHYKIAFIGLKKGIHQFEYQIDKGFFEGLDYSLIKSGDLTVNVSLNKQDALMVLDFEIKGTIDLPCDRCLETVHESVEGANRIIVKYGEYSIEESEEIIVLGKDEGELNIEPYIYEFINLLVPMKVVHEEGDCDPQTLAALKKLETKNSGVDPRWDALKNLYNKN
jgi:uncharacterized protein